MHERGKQQEVEVLRRLADLLRQAHSAASGENDKKSADMKKLRRRPAKTSVDSNRYRVIRPSE